jgi:formylglycine-generating enzyme required for sulfatase activity
MSKRRPKPIKTASVLRRRRRAWKWVAGVTIAVAAIVAFAATRPRPPAGEPLPAAEAATANRFLPTVENKNRLPGPAPDGMVWIPGGEFSMGAEDTPNLHDGVGMQDTRDSQPVHRVYEFSMPGTQFTETRNGCFQIGLCLV